MYTIERKYQANLLGTGTNPGDRCDVPWVCEQPVQYLVANIYLFGMGGTLGAGTAQVLRNGALVGVSTALVGQGAVQVATIPTPLASAGYIEPQTANRSLVDGIFELVAGVMTLRTGTGLTVAPPPLAIRLINTLSTPQSILVHWTALAWRNP